MDKYAITFARSATKELEGLEAKVVQRVFVAIESLARAPRPKGCKKLAGSMGLWRIRVGVFRVIYSIDDSSRTVDIIAIRHRREAYR